MASVLCTLRCRSGREGSRTRLIDLCRRMTGRVAEKVREGEREDGIGGRGRRRELIEGERLRIVCRRHQATQRVCHCL